LDDVGRYYNYQWRVAKKENKSKKKKKRRKSGQLIGTTSIT
jgi:hypothetical protein